MNHSEIKLASITDADLCINAIDAIKNDSSNYKKSSQSELLKAAQNKLDKLNLLLLTFDVAEPLSLPEIHVTEHAFDGKKTFSELLTDFAVLKADLALHPTKKHAPYLEKLVSSMLAMEIPKSEAAGILVKFENDRALAAAKIHAEKNENINIRDNELEKLTDFSDRCKFAHHHRMRFINDGHDVYGRARIDYLHEIIADKFSDDFITVRGPVAKLASVLEYVDIIGAESSEPRKVNRQGGRKADPKNKIKLEEAVKIILTGKTREQAAAEVGLGVATLYRYLKKNPIKKASKEIKPQEPEQKKAPKKEEEQLSFDVALNTESVFINTLFDCIDANECDLLNELDDDQLDEVIDKITQVMSEFSISDDDVTLAKLCAKEISKGGLKTVANIRVMRRAFETAIDINEKENQEEEELVDLSPSLLPSHEVIRNHALLSMKVSEEDTLIIKRELEKLHYPEKVLANSELSQKFGAVGVALARMKFVTSATVKKALSLLNTTDSFDAVDVVFSAFTKAELKELYSIHDGAYFDEACIGLREVLDEYDLPTFIKKGSRDYKELRRLGKMLDNKRISNKRQVRMAIKELGTIRYKDINL